LAQAFVARSGQQTDPQIGHGIRFPNVVRA